MCLGVQHSCSILILLAFCSGLTGCSVASREQDSRTFFLVLKQPLILATVAFISPEMHLGCVAVSEFLMFKDPPKGFM